MLRPKVFPTLADQEKQKDKVLFEKFLTKFPSTGRSCKFLSDQDVGAPFSGDDLKDLDNFINNWNNAEHVFLTKKIEKQKMKLWKLASEYRPELSRNIFAGPNGLLSWILAMERKTQRKRPREKSSITWEVGSMKNTRS